MHSEWVIAGLAVTAMVLTQAMGITLEALLVKRRSFPGCRSVRVPEDFGPATETEMDAYKQYERLYILLARLEEDEDTQGNMKRASAQFFLTNNNSDLIPAWTDHLGTAFPDS